MKQWKKAIGIVLAGVVLLTGIALPKNNAMADGKNYGIQSPRVANGVTTWDKIKFGSYNQEGTFRAEPIKWRVLSVDGDDALLLADQCLDARAYHDEKDEKITWENCTLRKWLNVEFDNTVFTEEEKKAVKETTVVNEDSVWKDSDGYKHKVEGGNDTKDRVYLLSEKEVENAAYGFDLEISKTRQARFSDYAKVNDIFYYDEWCYWQLRSPGYISDFVTSSGNACWGIYSEYSIPRGTYGVRPALHVNLSSSIIRDAGEVDSEGNATAQTDGIHAPREKDGVTTWDCIWLGNYNQTASWKQNPIEWRVLSVDGDDAFLLADRCLDAKLYHEEDEDVTWETCTLRKWLNEGFCNTAFTEKEKQAIKETTVVNEDSVWKDVDGEEYKVEGGNDTKDKVYLLSEKEASNSTYGFDTELGEESNTRQAKTSDYVKVNGGNSEGLYCYWWLRSPSIYHADSVQYVYTDGGGNFGGKSACYYTYGVRPALHINLSSYAWEKSGTVASNETDRPQITVTPMQSVEPTATPVVSKKPILTSNSSKNARLSDNMNQKKTFGSSVKKKIKLLGVRCKKNTKKIYGKVSISKATVKVKVGKKAYKKASVKGKKFTVKLKTKLKKKTKIVIKVTKKGYQTLAKKYQVK